MAARLVGRDLELVKKFNDLKYANQAKAFLHAHWPFDRSEEVFKFYLAYVAVDLHFKGLNPVNVEKCGVCLDETQFHYLLEKNVEAMTVLAARSKLREADVSFDGKVSLLEFLNWYFKLRIEDFVKNAPQVDELEGMKNMTPAMQKAYAALEAVRSEIRKIENEKARLEEESELGGVKGIRAKNQLQQLLSRDNTDLNRALLTAEAALRKAGGSGCKAPPAVIWWMERELTEMKAYRPQKKQ